MLPKKITSNKKNNQNIGSCIYTKMNAQFTEKFQFQWPEYLFKCGWKAKLLRKTWVFKNYPCKCGQGLSLRLVPVGPRHLCPPLSCKVHIHPLDGWMERWEKKRRSMSRRNRRGPEPSLLPSTGHLGWTLSSELPEITFSALIPPQQYVDTQVMSMNPALCRLLLSDGTSGGDMRVLQSAFSRLKWPSCWVGFWRRE